MINLSDFRRNYVGLIPTIIGFVFLLFFWVLLFPNVLAFDQDWNSGGGASLGPGPLPFFMIFGLIWTGVCCIFIYAGIKTFSMQGKRIRDIPNSQNRYSADYNSRSQNEYSADYNPKQDLNELLVCNQCGTNFMKEDRFCPNCGNTTWDEQVNNNRY